MNDLAPSVVAETIGRDIDALLLARERLLRRPVDEILARLDEVIGSWLAEGSPWMRQAEAVLAAHTGLAPAMLHHGLPRQLEPLRREAIERLLEEELGGREGCDAAPALIAHILPGNVPALAASAICLSLALRSAALIKPGADERWFAPLFVASLAAVDEELAACVAVRYWAGGASDVEDEVFRRADVVDFAGSDDALAAICSRVRGRFVGRGARLSFAAVGREILADPAALAATANAIAEDVSIWEQRGCLSPQVVLVETTSARELEVAGVALAAGLDDYARRWPPRLLSLEEKAALLRFRQAAEWGLDGEAGARVVRGDGGAWTILLERAASLRPTCLHRTLRLQPVADLASLVAVIEPGRTWLEAAGLAVDPTRLDLLRPRLVAAGLHRVCRVGEMQRPDLTWKPGGQPRVALWRMR